ncbi:MAG: hypothetical protein QJR06_07620 [Alicyclobacillaceae bacterium]|nr:hypothetical protein [Alicyclobacillaceae bacterium]
MPVMLFCVVCGRHFIGKREENTYNDEVICPFCIEKMESDVHGKASERKAPWPIVGPFLHDRGSPRSPGVRR